MCVRNVDDQGVLQFTLLLAAGCVLHRRTSRVIHRQELYLVFFSHLPVGRSAGIRTNPGRPTSSFVLVCRSPRVTRIKRVKLGFCGPPPGGSETTGSAGAVREGNGGAMGKWPAVTTWDRCADFLRTIPEPLCKSSGGRLDAPSPVSREKTAIAGPGDSSGERGLARQVRPLNGSPQNHQIGCTGGRLSTPWLGGKEAGLAKKDWSHGLVRELETRSFQ